MPDKLPKEIIFRYQPTQREQHIIQYVSEFVHAGENYRNNFKDKWAKIEDQLRCQHPGDWDKKEGWQTRVYLPIQAKTSETAASKFEEILHGQGRNFDISGVEESDRKKTGYLMTLIENILSRGDYSNQKSFMEREAIDIGTSFLKVLINENGDGYNFSWRSPYNCLCDPEARHDFYKSRGWCDEYDRDIGLMIEDVRNGKGLYTRGAINNLIMQGEDAAMGSTGAEDLAIIRDIDNTRDIVVHRDYKSVKIHEYWGRVPVLKTLDNRQYYEYENRLAVVANGTVLLKDEENAYAPDLPVFIGRTKRRKFDLYGMGYFDNTTDLQELSNSMICLGFDSLKISGMDIVAIDETKVSDPTSIVYTPMAIWKGKAPPREWVDIRRTGLSAIRDIMGGLGFIDSIHQDATGVTRHSQGAAPQPGTIGGGAETLGEYQAKSIQVDKRFLKECKMYEDETLLPLIKFIYNGVRNPKLFSQASINRILGMILTPVPVTTLDGTQVGVEGQLKKDPKILQSELPKTDDMYLDFKVCGVTKYYAKVELTQALEKVIAMSQVNPQVLKEINFSGMFKRWFQMLNIPDSEELLNGQMDMVKLAQIASLVNPGGTNGGQPPSQGNPSSVGAGGTMTKT